MRLLDCMPPREAVADVVRVVEGVRGRVPMSMELILRFDYGRVIPWVRRVDDLLVAVAGADAVTLATDVPTRGENLTTRADFELSEGDRASFVLTWFPSHERPHWPVDGVKAVRDTERWWREWARRGRPSGSWGDTSALPHHAEGTHVRPDWRDRGRADDLAPRAARWRPQIGTTASAGCATPR